MTRFLPSLILTALLLAGWEVACRALDVPVYLLPPPSAVAVALIERAPVLLSSAAATFWMAFQALIVAFILGGGLALAVSLNRSAERAIRPLAVALQVTPVIAIAPLVLIWAGLDHADRAVIALAAAVAFFPLFSGVLTGLKSADPDLERLFDLYAAKPVDRLLRLRLPASAPFVLEGLSVAAGQAVIGAVVAEFAAGAGNRLQTAKMFAALAVLGLMGAVLHGLFQLAERWALVRWRGR